MREKRTTLRRALPWVFGLALAVGASTASAQSTVRVTPLPPASTAEPAAPPPQAAEPAPPPAASAPEAPPPPAAPVQSAQDSLGFGPEPAATPQSSQDDVGFGGGSSGSSDDVGFGDSSGSSSAGSSDSSEPSPWSFTGSLREQTAVRSEPLVIQRLAKARLLLDLQLGYTKDFVLGDSPATFRFVAAGHGEYDFATLDHAAYDVPTREQYAWKAYPQDLYLALNWGALDLSFGKQTVTYGQGEVLSSLDVVNPRDLREPLVTDPSDMKLAMLMTRLGLRMGEFNLELMMVHEANPGLMAPPLGEYSPIRKLLFESGSLRSSLEGHDVRYEHRPEPTLWRTRSSQYHARLKYEGSGYELAFQAGSVLDAHGVASLPTADALAAHDINFDLFHPRYTLLGHSGTFTAGEFVVRWEASADINRLTATRRTDNALLRLESQRFTQLHGMVGITWVPDTQTNIALEYMQSYVLNEPTRHRAVGAPSVELLWPIEAPQFSLRGSHSFFDERATLTVLVLLIGVNPFNSLATRVDLTYKLTETIQAQLAYVAYTAGTDFGPLYGFGLNDRVLLNFRWDFTL